MTTEVLSSDGAERTSPHNHEHGLLDLLRHGHREEALERIRTNKDEVNMVDDGSTPILVATTRGWGDVVEALIEAGGNVNVTSDLGETPLMRAIKSGKISPGVIKSLLDHGAVDTLNVAAKDNAFYAKWTALHYACDSDMNHSPSVVALLVSYGANSKAVAGNGKSPADMCARNAEFSKALHKGKDYLKHHPLPVVKIHDHEHDVEPMQLGSELVMGADEPPRNSLLRLGRQLLGMGKKPSSVLQEQVPPSSPSHSEVDSSGAKKGF